MLAASSVLHRTGGDERTVSQSADDHGGIVEHTLRFRERDCAADVSVVRRNERQYGDATLRRDRQLRPGFAVDDDDLLGADLQPLWQRQQRCRNRYGNRHAPTSTAPPAEGAW